MADYASMTVVQIRDLFKQRGIPTTGLTKKAQLIERLIEQDDQAAGKDNDEAAETEHAEEGEQDGEQAAAEEAAPTVPIEAPVEASNDAPESTHKPEQMHGPGAEKSPDEHKPPSSELQGSENQEPVPGPETPPTATAAAAAAAAAEIPPTDHDDQNNEKQAQEGQVSESAHPKLSATTSPAPSISQASEGAVNPEESRKRKRRSASPPPSEEEVAQKKAKQEADGEKVILHEDIAATRVDPQPTPSTIPERERRFKDLVAPQKEAPPTHSDDEPRGGAHEMVEERDVEPAVHPATRALYIRNLKRPLRPDTVKAHLESIAQPTDRQQEASITEFFLDPIRTHCFVIFNSPAAASRVRSALHNLVWPPEGPRDPLWVDYVPEENVAEWINTETSTSGGRSGAHKWEIHYDRLGDGSVTTTLRDITGDGAPGPPRRSVTASTDPPSRPNASQAVPKPHIQREVSTRHDGAEASQQPASFLTLDALFKSTQAKPKLYFQPVAKEAAERRLAELDSLTTRNRPVPAGGSGYADSRRYTFEDGVLVDNGPEFGLLSRGPRPRPRRGRGGGGGGPSVGGRW